MWREIGVFRTRKERTERFIRTHFMTTRHPDPTPVITVPNGGIAQDLKVIEYEKVSSQHQHRHFISLCLTAEGNTH